MKSNEEIRNEFFAKKDKLFTTQNILKDPLAFSFEYSVLVEDLLREISADMHYPFALASAGSFSRRELSPYSDIDIMFIVPAVKGSEQGIKDIVTRCWDFGLEVSHTIRELPDIKRFLTEDLHTFTQFFETRYLFGSLKLFNDWNTRLFETITEKVKKQIFAAFLADRDERYEKYGNSPKVIEPNLKLSAGGQRDIQMIEWIYILLNKEILNKQSEQSQTESFITLLSENDYTTPKECLRLLAGFKFILMIRNLLHLLHKQKNDRFEFADQIAIADLFHYGEDGYKKLMKEYFNSSNVIYRFNRSFTKKMRADITTSLPDILSIDLDDDFKLKGDTIFFSGHRYLNISEIFRGFYYRGLYEANFDEHFRMQIIDSLDQHTVKGDAESSTFFREILRLPKNIGKTLSVMNELGILDAFLPEFHDMNGYIQHGVYHCYTADEHTIMTIQNVEKLENDTSELGNIYNNLKEKEILVLGLLFHDIAKPINVSGHEIIGAEMAASIMQRLGYGDTEIEKVSFLVRYHLQMEQIAFRRNLNDAETLNSFVAAFPSVEQLELLYLLTYADLSAVNPALWTSWKYEMLNELFRKAKAMIEDHLSGEELLFASTLVQPEEISKYSDAISEDHVKDHIDSINDTSYASLYSDEEIAFHIEEILSGVPVSVSFKEMESFTNITVISKDSPALLSKLCGVLSINDLNIHDAKIFTRKDGVIIDNFNVTDFRSNEKVDAGRYAKIEEDFSLVLSGLKELSTEMKKMKTKWWRIENKFFKRPGKVKITFEEQEKFTIIDVFSPDRLGFLYHVTSKLNELGLGIYFAKIGTRGDDIIDAFYVLDGKQKKVSKNFYSFIESELTEAINQIL